MAAGTELPDLEKRAAEAERRAAEMEHRYDRLTLAVRDNRDLEERVAALEAALTFACTTPAPRPMTGEQVAEFRRQFDEAVQGKPFEYRTLPSPPPLTPEQIRHLLRECVTVVKPGETLVIQDRNWNPEQVREIQQWMDAEHESGRITFKVLAVIGEELGIAEPGGIPGAA